MNARQKAKKYKKYIEKLENEVAIYRIEQRAEEFRRANAKRSIGTLETFKIVKLWDDRIPEEYLKREMAEEIGRFMIENKLIHWEVESGYNERMLRRITATVRAARNGGWEE